MLAGAAPRSPEGVLAAAAVRCLDDSSQGWLAAWATESRPHPYAYRADPAVIDFGGPAAAVSLVLPNDQRRPLFDDPSVVQAIRMVAAASQLTAVTTLTADPVHYAGSLLATSPAVVLAWPGWWSVDPFVRVGPADGCWSTHGCSPTAWPCSDRAPSAAPARRGFSPVVRGALCGIRVVRVDAHYVPCPEPDTNVGARGQPVRVALLTSVDG